MERSIDELKLHKIKLAKARALNENPVPLATISELNAEEQRIKLGRPSKKLDPVTQAFIDTIRAQHRGKDLHGVSLFRPHQSRD
jgi:hypothetical protein